MGDFDSGYVCNYIFGACVISWICITLLNLDLKILYYGFDAFVVVCHPKPRKENIDSINKFRYRRNQESGKTSYVRYICAFVLRLLWIV